MLPITRWLVIVKRTEPVLPNTESETERYYFKDEEAGKYWAWAQLAIESVRAEVGKTIVFHNGMEFTHKAEITFRKHK